MDQRARLDAPNAVDAPAAGEAEPLESLQRALERTGGGRFGDLSLLRRAMTHRSYSNEHPDFEGTDNERLEFLGDAVLDFVAGSYLFEHYPEMQEGELTSLRAALVRTETLADFAREMGLHQHILVGRGEENSGGRQRPAILCGAFEALIGALYLDQGLEAASRLFHVFAEERVRDTLERNAARDAKSQLQELTQMLFQLTPRYVVLEARGPDHAKEFTVEVWVGDQAYGRGTGSSKQKATQRAARAALRHPFIVNPPAPEQTEPATQGDHD